MRAWSAVFAGAFLIALIYSTKSENGPVITIARNRAAADAPEKPHSDSTADSTNPVAPSRLPADTLTAQDPAAIPPGPGLQPSVATGLSSPTVVPADLEMLRTQGPIIPVAGVTAKELIDSFDDMRGGTRRHSALDILALRNTPVLSATSGTILKLHNSAAGGLTIYASDRSSRFVLMYGHLDSYRPGLKEGGVVKRGEIIGFVGSTGNANMLATHLHFQITRNDNIKEWWKGTPVNPFPLLRPK